MAKKIVVCGAGVIGAACAYYLSLRGAAVTVIERNAVACAASGKAGGFLALDWCDGSALGPLARASFALHEQLANSSCVDCGYRRMTTFSINVPADGPQYRGNDGLDWLDRQADSYALLGSEKTTAQVHPARFTRALLDSATQRGAQLLIGRVEQVEVTDGRVAGVRVDGGSVAADAVVIALGPWSSTRITGLALPPVAGLKGHSITLQPKLAVPAHALFVSYRDTTGAHSDPEIYPRPDGEVYLCGLSDDSPVPERPQDVSPRPDAAEILSRMGAHVSSVFDGLEARLVQACFRPIYRDALPVLGPVPDVSGAYLACGHNCWGILNAPASGRAMAELICDGASQSVDLTPFAAQRLSRDTLLTV